jgi:thioredoxin-like negative regulator of GroEL
MRLAMTNRSPLRIWVLGLALAGIATATGQAQQVAWRTDYNSARKEATEKHRPILIEFSTENCTWCKKLDAATLRDPEVVAALGDQFVALKIDADSEPALTQALRISQFPTLVLASPDGKIIGVLEGYQEAPALAGQLKKIGATYSSPEWMLRDFQEAAKAISASDYSRAIALLKSIAHDGNDRGVQVKARQVLADLERQASGQLTQAKQLSDRGQSAEAAGSLAELLRAYAGTQAATDGSALLTTIARKTDVRDQVRTQRARELLSLAREDFRAKEYLGCLERCEKLTQAYADLPEAAEAQSLASSIKDNPEQLAHACEILHERVGSMYLALANSWLKKGDSKEAQRCLEKIIQAAPGTWQAELAQVHLAKLQRGSATLPAEFKKPATGER